MNKLRILSVVCMTMAFTLITSGYSMMFLDSYKVDASEKSYYSSMIKTSFNSYIQDTKDISYNIKNTNMFNSKYYAEIKNSHSTSIAELNEIELNVKNISYYFDRTEFDIDDVHFVFKVPGTGVLSNLFLARLWLDSFTQSLVEEMKQAKAAGKEVYYHIDLFVLPKNSPRGAFQGSFPGSLANINF